MTRYEFYANLQQYHNKKNELQHHGILGQKWGIRRFQEKDGSYTQAGRERYGIGVKRESNTDVDPDEQKVGYAALIAVGIAGLQLGTYAIHDAMISSSIKRYEKHRNTEETDPETGLKLKSNKEATIKDDMKFVNRESKMIFGGKGGSTENCMLCTTALDLKRRGYDVKAGKATEGFYARDILRWYTGKKNDLNMNKYDNVVDMLKKEPEGSYGNFMVYWKRGGGHSMFYKIENGKPVIYDAQTNHVYSINKISKYANKQLPGTCFIRTDNMTPDYQFLIENGLIA